MQKETETDETIGFVIIIFIIGSIWIGEIRFFWAHPFGQCRHQSKLSEGAMAESWAALK